MPNIEELLRSAMAEGKFDDLPGKGKRINLGEENPFADPEWELAYKMLKESGYSLPWIEEIREVETALELARQELKRAWEWRQAAIADAQPASSILAEWQRALDRFTERLGLLNKRIRDYNLQVPSSRFQRPVLKIDQEINNIKAS